MRKIILALALLWSGSAWAQVGQIATWPPKAIVIGGGVVTCSSPVNTETATWATNVASAGGSASDTQCGYVDTLVSSLKSALGTPLSSNVSRLWLATSADTTAGDIAAQFKVDVIHGSLLDFTNANIATRLDHLTGYTPNGTSEYIKTGFIPSSSDTGVFGLNSASMGVYVLNHGSTDSGSALSAYDGTNTDQINPLFTTNYLAVWVNIAAGDYAAIGPGPSSYFGFNMANRTASNAWSGRLYNTGTPLTVSPTVAPSGLPTVALYINAQNNNGTAASFSPVSTGAVILGSGAIADTAADAVAVALNVYMTSVGAAHW